MVSGENMNKTEHCPFNFKVIPSITAKKILLFMKLFSLLISRGEEIVVFSLNFLELVGGYLCHMATAHASFTVPLGL